MASVTQRLIFDPTDANTLASSSSVGAFVRAGTDGDLIGSKTIDSSEWLQVAAGLFDGNGVAIDSTDESGVQSLAVSVQNDVVVSASDLDIRDLTHVSDSVSLGDGTTLYTGTTVGSDHGLDVNVINADEIDIDDDLADTAIENTATAVSTTAIDLVTSALAARKWLWLANEGNKSLYWGKTGVTAANGFPLHPGMQHVARVGESVAPQVIGRTGASNEDLRVMELS